ncbi:formate hydrogenlyase maturation protein HycH [Berryella wangjianweii]|uniref:Formate hydrogenlyase maturation protein HycH n=1 Tax=Berryella wangjianweii TaxID=2734634 RepID=A0A6M8J466_9ACTN|nr:formate hydrogenlyase maturation protein HycH [Berryella wangjianweii]QKF07403.1 formate hydrogenlyase maturation protein HycH [Berryella wangjianweii]
MGTKPYIVGENRMESIGTVGDKVLFYLLRMKFVDRAESIPDDAQDVLYYTLSVGHHTGVVDCFERVLEVPVDSYRKITELLESDEARRKLEGVLRFGEIEVGKEHVRSLLPAARRALSNIDVYNEPGKTSMPLDRDELPFLMEMIKLFMKVRDETNVYLMVRRGQ